MPTEDCKMNQLEAENEKLKRELKELREEGNKLSSANRTLDSLIYDLKNEKSRLLDVIENLSKGFANIESATKK